MDAVVITAQKRTELDKIGSLRDGCKNPELTRRKSDVFSDCEVDQLGMYGEYAVASYFGLDFDRTISATGDNGYDVEWNGLKIAVKYNHRWRGYLMVEERDGDNPKVGDIKDFTSDIIVLAHGKCAPPERCHCREKGGVVVVLAGWLTKAEFLDKMELKDLGLGGRYIVTCDQLRPMHQLWQPYAILRAS